jgi:hypothetical protein
VRVPSCIVGNILNQLDLLQFVDYDSSAREAIGEIPYDVASFDPDVIPILARLQVKQDGGMSWGVAFREAFNSDVS